MIASETMPRWPAFSRGHRIGRPAGAAGACRALFRTREDVPESLDYLQHELTVIANESRQRWNFDFDAGRPLAGGRYQWNTVHQSAPNRTPTEVAAETPTDQPTSTAANTSPSLKQTKMSDYWCNRKRHCSSPAGDGKATPNGSSTAAKVQKRNAST